ncbi:MAG: FecR domain-containing protein [Chitinophaga sp.]|uniref:FecR family protein n=1 Tax=Chitinophaga sp. TaxID=1869181 RepID=UPI001B101179|nr:FecR family protein [Chitinophaga sp.]MBO9730889.1 FecR domain-containing protein [Chitinophaga sp.]
MNNPGQTHVDDELLAKYFSGEASPEEAIAVDDWVHASAENRALFEQALAVWEQTSIGHNWQLPDKSAMLTAIQQERIPAKGSAPAKVASLKTFRWRIAAAVIVLIGVASLYWLLRPTAPATLPGSLVLREAHSGVLQDTLPDRSVVTLNSGASISYASNFVGNTRQVLLKGSATFDVTTDPKKPFIVSVGDIAVKVLGTTFLVATDTAGVMVSVKSGAVGMYRGDSSIILKAGETGIYHNNTHGFSVAGADSISMTRSFNFTNASLKEIATQLELAYGTRIVFNNKKLEGCSMSSTFDNKSLLFILEVISITLNVQYSIEKDTVYLSGSGCN